MKSICRVARLLLVISAMAILPEVSVAEESVGSVLWTADTGG
jgi:hypothetical protein